MRGTVTKKRDRWYICYYIGKDAKGKWKQKWEGSWDTKKAAEKVLRQRITELEETFERKGESSTLKVYLQNWLDTYCTERLAPNTIRGYRVNVEKHIAPYIGQIRLNDLKPSDIQGLYSKLLAQGLSGTTVRYVHNNLHRALSVAVRQQLLTRNPADCVEPPVIDHYEAATLNDKQVRQLLTACRDTSVQHGCDSHQCRVQCIPHPLHGLAHNGFSGLRVRVRRHIHRRAGYHADADAPQKCGQVHLYLTPFPYSTSISRRREKNTRCFLPNRPQARYNNI